MLNGLRRGEKVYHPELQLLYHLKCQNCSTGGRGGEHRRNLHKSNKKEVT